MPVAEVVEVGFADGDGGGAGAGDAVFVGDDFAVVVPLVVDVGAFVVEGFGGEVEGGFGAFVGGDVVEVLGDGGAVVDGEVDFITVGGAAGVGGLEAVFAGLGGVNFFEGEGALGLFVYVSERT